MLIKVFLAVAILSLMLFTVWERSAMVQLGYEIEQMKREKVEKLKRQQMLLVEYYELVSLDRIEVLATTQLGLIWPKSGQVVLVSRSEDALGKVSE